MKQYLLPEGGNFYKANMHIHTTISDGNMTPEEVKAWHVDHGYSIVAFTDHEALVPHNDLTDENFLAVTAVEVMIIEAWPGVHAYKRCYHLNLYAKDKNKDVYSTFDEKSFWPAHAKEFVTEECAAVIAQVEDRFPALRGKVQTTYVGTTIGAHTGPGAVGVFFWGDPRTEE